MVHSTVDWKLAGAIVALALIIIIPVVTTQPPYLSIDCEYNENGDITKSGYLRAEGMPALNMDTVWNHCQQRRESVHPTIYDYHQKIEFLLTGELKP